jgi:hypothetical protein
LAEPVMPSRFEVSGEAWSWLVILHGLGNNIKVDGFQGLAEGSRSGICCRMCRVSRTFSPPGWILVGGAAVQQCSSDATMQRWHDAGPEAFLI